MTNSLDAHVVVPAGWTKEILPVPSEMAEKTGLQERLELLREKDETIIRIGLFAVDGKAWLQYAAHEGDTPVGKNLLAKMLKQICPKAEWLPLPNAEKNDSGAPLNGIAWVAV